MIRILLACLITLVLFACGAAQQEETVAETDEEAAPQPTAAVAEMLPNAKRPEPDLLTGGQPSTEQLDRIAEAGFKTVISLRQPDEVGQLPASEYTSRGLAFRSMPIAGKADINEANSRAFSNVLADSSLRPLVIHCGSGNRIGALFALRAFHVDGMATEDALQVGFDTGLTRLEPVVREQLELAAAEDEAAAGS